MLDPLAQAARLPNVARALEGVERGAVGRIADRVHADRPARLGAVAHDLLELLARRDHDTAAVAHPGGLRAERPVHERLQVAEPEQGRACAAAEAQLAEVADPLGRCRLPDAERQAALLLEPLPEADRAEPAVLVVQRRDAAPGRDLDALAHRLDVLLGRHLDEARLEAPRRLLVEHAGRLAGLVPDDDAALDLEVAARERERGRVEPERVVVLGDQHRRPVAHDLVERLPRGRAVGPVGVAPALAAQPAPGWRRGAHPVERLGERRAVVQLDVALRQRPGREVDVRVGEAGQDAATAEVDRLRARQRGLVHPDAAGDPLARDPERGDGRQRRVERADRPVAEDHGAEPSPAGPRQAGFEPRLGPPAPQLRQDDDDERHEEHDDRHRDHLRQLAREAQRRVEVDRERLSRPDEERRDRVLVERGRERDHERGDDGGQDQRQRHPAERRERAGAEVIGRLAERSVDLPESRPDHEDRVGDA